MTDESCLDNNDRDTGVCEHMRNPGSRNPAADNNDRRFERSVQSWITRPVVSGNARQPYGRPDSKLHAVQLLLLAVTLLPVKQEIRHGSIKSRTPRHDVLLD